MPTAHEPLAGQTKDTTPPPTAEEPDKHITVSPAQRVLGDIDLLHLILKKLEPCQLFNCSLTCKAFDTVASPTLWKHFKLGGELNASPSTWHRIFAHPHSEHACLTRTLTVREHFKCDLLEERKTGGSPDNPLKDIRYPNLHTVVFETDADLPCFPFWRCDPRHLIIRASSVKAWTAQTETALKYFNSIERTTLILNSRRNSWTNTNTNSPLRGFESFPSEFTIVLVDFQWERQPSPMTIFPPTQREIPSDFCTQSLGRCLFLSFKGFENCEEPNSSGRNKLETAKVRVFDLVPQNEYNRFARRLNTREYMTRLLCGENGARVSAERNAPRLNREQLHEWFGEHVEWGGIRKFLKHDWDGVFDTQEIEKVFSIFSSRGLQTDYPPDDDAKSVYHNSKLEDNAYMTPFDEGYRSGDDSSDDCYDYGYEDDLDTAFLE